MWGYGPGWGMMGGYGYGGLFWLGHMIIWLIILAALVIGVMWLVRNMSSGANPSLGQHRSPGLDALEERYARGEIGREEYLQKRRDIGA